MIGQNITRDSLAIISEYNEVISYAELESLSEDLASVLNPGSLVFCLCTNTVGSLLGYYSFLNNKIVPVMLDALKDPELLSYLLDLYEPNYVDAGKSTSLE